LASYLLVLFCVSPSITEESRKKEFKEILYDPTCDYNVTGALLFIIVSKTPTDNVIFFNTSCMPVRAIKHPPNEQPGISQSEKWLH